MTIEQLHDICIEKGIFAQKDALLKNYTTFKIGGPASLFLKPVSLNQVQECIQLCRKANIKPFILGNGSNVLFSSKGYKGVILYIGKELSNINASSNSKIVSCEAGASLSSVCLQAEEHHLTGLEFAYGIPGTVGGAVYMNAGAFGGEMQDVVKSVTYITEDGDIETVQNGEIGFAYRSSIFQKNNGCIITIEFALQEGNALEIKEKMSAIAKRRAEKQPLNMPSAGSTFKRPEGAYAAALIEKCGLKGKQIGGAMVSEKHAGFIVNANDATDEDVLHLIHFVQETVLQETGFQLEPEVQLIQ